MKGFVDIQVNGWMGVDFASPELTLEDIHRATKLLRDCATIAYCPTVMTRSSEIYRRNLPLIADAMDDGDLGGHIAGIHIEGPFISPQPGARGAHPLDRIRPPSTKEFDEFQEWARGNVRILTLAPEVPGAEELIRHATGRGVTVLMGHHLAGEDAMAAAVAAGAAGATHVGNAIPNEIHRHRNPLWWQLACDDLYGLFITDGHHLPASLITVALRAKGVERFVVTSDSSPLGGMPAGEYTVDGLPVVVGDSGMIYSETTKSLACSHANMLECMNYLASLGLLDEKGLWKVGRENPLRLLGMAPSDLAHLSGAGAVFRDGRFETEQP